MGMGSERHVLAFLAPGRDPVLLVHAAGWAPEPVWVGGGKHLTPRFDLRTVQPVFSSFDSPWWT
jgi:hypothetical protein